MKEIVDLDVKHLNTRTQAFGAFKAVRHRMVENYLGIEQNDAHSVQMRMLASLPFSQKT